MEPIIYAYKNKAFLIYNTILYEICILLLILIFSKKDVTAYIIIFIYITTYR